MVELRRASLHGAHDGTLWAELHESQSSGALRSVAESDCLAELAAAPHEYAAGDIVPVHRVLA